MRQGKTINSYLQAQGHRCQTYFSRFLHSRVQVHSVKMFRYLVLVAFGVALAYGGYAFLQRWRAGAAFEDGQAALDEGAYGRARLAAQRAADLRPDYAETHLLLARIARMENRIQEATPHFQRYLRLGGLAEAMELEHLLARTRSGDLSAAGRLHGLIQLEHPQSAWIQEAIAWGCLQSYRLHDAATSFDEFLKVKPRHVPGLAGRAKTAHFLKDHLGAIEHYRRAVAVDPTHTKARLELADSLLAVAQSDEALPHYQLLYDRCQEQPAATIGLAKTCLLTGEFERATRYADEALSVAEASGDKAEAALVRGKIAIAADDPARAEHWLRASLANRAEHREALHLLVQSLRRLDKQNEANEWQTRLDRMLKWQERLLDVCRRISQAPHDSALRHQAATLFLEVGNHHEAARWLRSALVEDPQHIASHRLLSEIYRRQGENELAALHEKQASP
jgi:tetratricopeptide (TPR) repeat protein